ncbi:copper chaperone CopZ [Leucobacter exalbidus]|uniref:Copper chaperone CopZ n=1 Tax=Leucobacter exalbidus TaxID=662960 RepID=A0A940PTD9_9MICO|nr:heavy-metal-associated domain-containing protein [Leucobacter exalbidus]MBP1326517.1 copper chaperone CopZ [Leucobacter exalbidus]
MSTTTEFQVTGMTCGHCEQAVREELGAVEGITEIAVSAETGKLTITHDAPIADDAVIAAVDEAGYVAVRS